MYDYIYIYIERERERGGERGVPICHAGVSSACLTSKRTRLPSCMHGQPCTLESAGLSHRLRGATLITSHCARSQCLAIAATST